METEVLVISKPIEVFNTLDENLGNGARIVLQRDALGQSVYVEFGSSLSMNKFEVVSSIVEDEGLCYSLYPSDDRILMKIGGMK
ncbi:hypothetical protein [Methanonatronarchaeum thermophilum]|uniref:hypothetical protein n=1 Tax=Methanonatronarchaeum thermophilum TaxID=1927129 RepID=UPI00117AF2AA|nr:hypothetical protein [Methanonatronarchaeum thermophilum]